MENSNAKVKGHVLIRDMVSGDILLDKDNSINFETMSIALAKSLGNKSNGPINLMAFGNGASVVDSLGQITYLDNTLVGQNATLYNETYSKVIDDNDVNNSNTTENNIVIEHEDGQFYTDIVCTCTLSYGEPSDQSAFDTTSAFSDNYVFDELGLKTSDGTLLSRVIFSPIEKSMNRIIEVIYTVRISMQ